MVIGVVGLGRMGRAITLRLLQAGHQVFGYDIYPVTIPEPGFTQVATLPEITKHVHIIWLMIPAGPPVDQVVETLLPFLHPQDIIIDGGNSNFRDSIRRHEQLALQNIHLLDCGTSGGLAGLTNGFSLMVGGNYAAFQQCDSIFKALAARDGYGYTGPSGSGHYVKMVHNGIEYALLQAYAEGFHLLKHGYYKDLDLAKISHVWNNGSVIRSWILQLAHEIFIKDQDFTDIRGTIAESGTGRWTVEEAHRFHIPVKLIEDALMIRALSRETGGDYATKIVALLRNKFGGHPVEKEKKLLEP
jgi:6-phosphogluconate dehydrogenase